MICQIEPPQRAVEPAKESPGETHPPRQRAPRSVSPEAAAAVACDEADRLAVELARALEDRAVALRALLKAGQPRPPLIRMLHRRSVDGALFAAGVAGFATVEHVMSAGRRTFAQQLRSAIATKEN